MSELQSYRVTWGGKGAGHRHLPFWLSSPNGSDDHEKSNMCRVNGCGEDIIRVDEHTWMTAEEIADQEAELRAESRRDDTFDEVCPTRE